MQSMSCRWQFTKKQDPLPSGSPALDSNFVHNPISVSSWHAHKPELKRRLLVTLLTAIFYYYPSLLTATLSLFTCYRIDPSNPSQAMAYPRHLQASIFCQAMPAY